ncbi:MAG: hypothetical protein V5A74_04570, partial [Desulfohalobiaceae bacterium]
VIVGILSALGGMIITSHMEGYGDMRRRAELVDSAESALRRMQRDIRAALPNSVEPFEGNQAVSFLHTSDGGRYRSRTPGNILHFDQSDNATDMIGRLYKSNATTTNSSISVYNTGQSPANAYNGTNITPITNVTNGTNGSDRIEFQSIQFPYSSPYQRFFVVDSQVCYVLSGDELIRYERDSRATLPDNEFPDDNDITAPNNLTSSDWKNGALLARHVKNATFTYHPGTPSRSGLMTLKLTLEDEGERVSLLHQVHVLNFP